MLKLRIFTLLLLLVWSVTQAQQPTIDQIETNKGPLKIQPITHGSVVLQWGNISIWVDPYGGIDLYKGLAAPDLILITDIHADHLDLKTLEAVNTTKAKIIAPQAVMDLLPLALKAKTSTLTNGNKTTQLAISITAVPMYNLPDTTDSRHPKGRGNGYILELGGKRVYFSGDTEDIPEMRALKDIEVAFICMNLPYTMDIDQAASAVLDFKPKVVYPYHYRGQENFSDVKAFKQKVTAGNKKIDVRLRKWYPGKE